MSERTVVVLGLPGSGKTTFLAALWHLVVAEDVNTKLKLDSLGSGEITRLNDIARRWREANTQDHTSLAGSHLIRMNLKTASGDSLHLVFPDVAGEEYQRVWTERVSQLPLADHLRSSSVLLFIHADDIERPIWLADINAQAARLGFEVPDDGTIIDWDPRLSPTQVPLVDLLQLLHRPPLEIGSRRLAIVFSAWEKVPEPRDPSQFLHNELPLLAQYLNSNRDKWTWNVFGVSAQGGDYDNIESDQHSAEAQLLRELERASDRIKVEGVGVTGKHDLTEPLAWLLE